MFQADRELTDQAVRLCQQLVQIDTTNPPGNEQRAAELVADELAAAGLEPALLQSAPARANVVARLAGSGAAPPLLLAAHLDVVEADPSQWTHAPFSGEIADGCLWGRGAIDMKNMAAMSLALMCRLAHERRRFARDLIFAAVADEETGCRYGSAWLCDEHPHLVRAEYAMGEGGGFNIYLGSRMIFTVEVAEKGTCWVKARVRGEPGHGSMPRAESAVVRLAQAVARLGTTPLPPHRTRAVDAFIDGLAAAAPAVVRPVLGALVASGALPRLVGRLPDASVARGMAAMLANTAAPTVLRAGHATNVIPEFAEAQIDGRLLPGQSNEDFLREIGAVLGPDVQLEVVSSSPPVETIPMQSPLYDTIVDVVGRREPAALVVPYLAPGFTDGKSFARLGARWYGFAPVKMPRGLRFGDLFHGIDERVPLDGLRWGTEVLAEVVTRFADRSGRP
jgi:acetylornithine deacetylase/succinyl-diaminopimelate desuccinylase-like protein